MPKRLLVLLAFLGLCVPQLLEAQCQPSSTNLCLNNGRFQVSVDWRTSSGMTGPGRAVPLTADTGYFWFFGPDNVELVVKVLNGCGLNQRFWVFAGGLTDVEVNLRVEDRLRRVVKTYRNPLGTGFQPLQDTSAFATCSTADERDAQASAWKGVADPAASPAVEDMA